jgi:glutathione S-transferase
MYKVIGHPRTRTMRVLWMLEELGEEYQIDPASPRSAAVMAANPLGKVPALMDGDAALTDSVAIVTYLADKNGRFTASAGTVARARQDGMTQFCVDEIEGALWTAAKNSFVNPEAHRCAAIRPVCEYEFEKAITGLERFLGDNEFVMGNAFTVPDLLIGHSAGWAKNAKFEIKSPKVAAYVERVRARPALARAMKRGAEALGEAA